MRALKLISLVVAALCIISAIAAVVGAADKSRSTGPGGIGRPNQGEDSQKYTISQTISDRGQQATIAFDGLAFLTGDACSDTFLPPGKVADYAGFQYLRDNDASKMGHNTDFVTRASDNVLSILNSQQLDEFISLSKTEAPLSSQYAYMRFPIMKAFRAQLEGNIPDGSASLDRLAVMDYSSKLYDVDASISIQRAKVYARVIRSLNQSQRAFLDRMASGGMLTWPAADASSVLESCGKGNSVAMRTYASEMFSWYAGSIDADVYFCPERQATYFGSFYMKDRPAMGNAGYSISTTLTGDAGEGFLDILDEDQRKEITSLVDIQRADLSEIVGTRKAIAAELRQALNGRDINETAVRSLSARYGELDGEISCNYAMHFAEVEKTATVDQKQKMNALRNLDSYVCEGAYLYSQPISMPQNIPVDFLFGIGSYNSSQISSWIMSLPQESPAFEPGPARPNQMPEDAAEYGKDVARPGKEKDHHADDGGRQGQLQDSDQRRRMPPENIIARLEQQGYNVSEAKEALKTDDRNAVKTWLDLFRKNNPGVVEGIERLEGNNPSSQPGPINSSGYSIAKNESATKYSLCLLHTRDNPECKDCCDCLEGNATDRKTCRDACSRHNFSLNTDFIAIHPISVAGPNGNYSSCTASGNEQACKECCDGSLAISSGDRRYCRDACNALGTETHPPAKP